MSRTARLLLLALATALSTQATAQTVDPAPRRVVSLGVCADQMLLQLADPGQIAMLSEEAGNTEISYLANIAAIYPQGDGAEALVGIAPDLVLADATTPLATIAAIEALGYPTVRLQEVVNLDEAIDQIRLVGTILGRTQQAEDLAAIVEAARQQAARTNWGNTAISIRRGAYVPGDDTLMTDLLAVIGLNNIGEALSGGSGRVSLEVLIAMPPTYLIVPEIDRGVFGGGLAMLDHPALAERFPPAQRMLIPDRLTYCPGPSLPEALRRLASELARVTP